MGRRKIEIRAIKDDRNRSVTFLKRKGGLFKKAHELSVLCSVDVAVIIFGHNKKLYEFSSGDINETLHRYQYYGQPHEHKGPGDYKNKGGDDDDEDEDDDNVSQHRDESVPPQYQMQPPLAHNNFAHIRQPHASASPPMPNGMFPPRHGTPQPPGQMGSRPSSRDAMRRLSQPMGHIQHPQATSTPPPNGYAFVQNQAAFNPQMQHGMPHQPSPQPPFQQYPPPQQQQSQPPPPQQQQPLAPPPQQAFQNVQQHQRQTSLTNHQPQNNLQPPQLPPARASPQPEQTNLRPPEQTSPPQPIHISSKSHSIFTPIDDGGSVLAQMFFGAPDLSRSVKKETSPEIKPPPAPAANNSRTTTQATRSQAASEFQTPSRSNTGSSRSGVRPKLNLQIPSEASDNESTENPSPQQQSAGPSANPVRASNDHIVLPPPSPSTGAVMSAGANGPPNPFARPPPPTNTNSQNRDAFQANNSNSTTNNTNSSNNNNNNTNSNIDTPVSALPSRYLNNDLLPSPSNLFGEWSDAFGRNGGLNSAILPSPLAFPTPSDSRGSGFGSGNGGRNESDLPGEKRKGSLSGAEKEADAKKVKAS